MAINVGMVISGHISIKHKLFWPIYIWFDDILHDDTWYNDIWHYDIWNYDIWHCDIWHCDIWHYDKWQMTLWHKTLWHMTLWHMTLWNMKYHLIYISCLRTWPPPVILTHYSYTKMPNLSRTIIHTWPKASDIMVMLMMKTIFRPTWAYCGQPLGMLFVQSGLITSGIFVEFDWKNIWLFFFIFSRIPKIFDKLFKNNFMCF